MPQLNHQNLEEIVRRIVTGVVERLDESKNKIPVGVSNRHIHLSKNDREILFGKDYATTKIKDLTQPGQFACQEVVTIQGPKNKIDNVRILGPDRKQTQVEIAQSDCIKLGIVTDIRESGDLKNSSPITIIGPKETINLKEGAIISQRHLHLSDEEAKQFEVNDGQIVSVRFLSKRGGTFDNVLVRSGSKHKLEMHLDTDEANAMSIKNGDFVEIVK